MMTLYVVKDFLQRLYGKYHMYITPALKLILSLVSIITINSKIGYMDKLKNPLIVFLLAVVCTFMPNSVTVLILAALIVLHMIAHSLELAAIVLFMFVILYLVYFRFSAKSCYAVILTPMAFALNIPYVVPVVIGLLMGPFASIAMICGIFVYYIVKFTMGYNLEMIGDEEGAILEIVKYIVDNALFNREMIAYMLAFTVTVIVVYAIRRLSVDYSWLIATGAGVLTNIVLMILTQIVLTVKVSTLGIVLGSILAIVVGVVLFLLVFSVDYTRTEIVQFEDDDYYYYVKAVPKIAVTKPNLQVKKINAQKTRHVAESNSEDEE